jgi:ATP-binding cassette, subfamily F, member 3
MLNFANITLRRGPRKLLECVSFTVYPGWRVGVVGRNGTGKSSLFSMILGKLAPDAGELSTPKALTIATVAQESPATSQPAIEYVLDGDTELRAAQRELAKAEAAHDAGRIAHLHDRLNAIGGYAAHARAAKLLDGLGFAPAEQTRAVAEFSGGWRMRLNLARALMRRADLLLLDEPTNHLDLDAVIWLQSWLATYPGTLLVIAHDRAFLDAITTHTLHLYGGAAQLYTGNYSQFERMRAERFAQQMATHEQQQRHIAHLQAFVDRFRAKATKAKQAQARLKMIERIPLVAPAHAETEFTFHFPEPERLPSPLLRLDRVSVGYMREAPRYYKEQNLPYQPGERHEPGSSAAARSNILRGNDVEEVRHARTATKSHRPAHDVCTVLSNIELSLEPGDRIGLLGPNGAGKSTFIKLLAGELRPLTGDLLRNPCVNVGYFAQHQLEQLDHVVSPVEHLRRLDPRVPEQALRDYLGSFNFRGERAFEAVAPFSGGEKARLALALVVYRRPNLLLLDEPTNHFDLDMRRALELALQDYAGALVLVSHDRHLIGASCDTLWRVADGRVMPFDGDLDDYARWLVARRGESTERNDANAKPSPKDQRRAAAQRRERLRPLREKLKDLEGRMAELQARLGDIEKRLTDTSLYDETAKHELGQLLREQGEISKTMASLEEEWLMATEQLESSEACTERN